MIALPKVNFSTSIKNGFINYVNFSGRIRRSEYWFFLLLINTITFLLLLLFILFITEAIGRTYHSYYYYYDYYYGYYTADEDAIFAFVIVLPTYIAGIMLPTLSATVRRLHDVGRRGEYIFIGLVPFFGGIALLVLLCQDSMKEANEFGPSPKYIQNNNFPLMQTPAQSLENQLLPKDNIIMQNNNIAYPNNNIIYNSNNSQPIPMDVLNNNSINNND